MGGYAACEPLCGTLPKAACSRGSSRVSPNHTGAVCSGWWGWSKGCGAGPPGPEDSGLVSGWVWVMGAALLVAVADDSESTRPRSRSSGRRLRVTCGELHHEGCAAARRLGDPD